MQGRRACGTRDAAKLARGEMATTGQRVIVVRAVPRVIVRVVKLVIVG